MAETARLIEGYVQENPGVHFSGIVDGLGTAPGQTQYHLRALVGSDELVKQDLYGRTHYYPPAYGEWERGALALLRRETARDVLLYLFERSVVGEEVGPRGVADALGIARSTLEWHLDHLVEQNVVVKRRVGNRVYLRLTEPERTIELLREIQPSVPGRLVDRFIRLVDGMLEE